MGGQLIHIRWNAIMKVSLRSSFSKHTNVFRNQGNYHIPILCLWEFTFINEDTVISTLHQVWLRGQWMDVERRTSRPCDWVKWPMLCEKEGCGANRTPDSAVLWGHWLVQMLYIFCTQLRYLYDYFLPVKILNIHFTIKKLFLTSFQLMNKLQY